MFRILANDGIDPIGKELLEKAGFQVDTTHIPQDQLSEGLKNYDGITVRSATKVRKDLIDTCPNIKLIGRGGVGMDNIDVDYARSKGLAVVNTPAASSLSVAELVFAHLFTGIRFLQDSNRKMPVEGNTKFNDLKKAYAKGIELRGKKIGIIGFGRIGRETAKVALGLGMEVLAYDLFDIPNELEVVIGTNIRVNCPIKVVTVEQLIKESDFISLHVPFSEKPVLGKEEFESMKNGVGVVNCSRGGTIDEDALIEALNSGKVAFAGLDVFDNEPTPRQDLLTHPKVSLTPHIGASTNEAQERIGTELANLIIDFFKTV
ncbi:MAG: 3-phosphoglycerate dehydrogenase [Sphingobacteriales bacterium 17-39-43]|uniref:D-2-hydroxyacid dehydrogenase n=1 Tax=Daejeonella sp. TaxID=2805397 RepID=UPI000BCF5923|nr:D-2-hydroxyacid dehydrogenase [Daejeonella sp.]OYZ32935.1 MAG: 3-phosphoglycerate dehydrogenase [Sphingobacteriales bacterium 16-39-50]OZA26345.1 MAG: 3-phosphoglycerate dehydrogenase [Sphingobacteriales bacterium 17-39-43]OZA61739.1 MAG: 3-phosphoglycerate dehydrogenase [Sphingobacteriales bacterium 39-40-5]HQS50654.1 D-2-hydroxyacid dehydrogenase [Daejeonella sp.]HQT21471.1 D-2-hydroxyacid dehydrogenase [Daejeonella sp.]